MGAALVLIVFAAYANSLRTPFVYDDVEAILNNPTLRGDRSLADVLLPPAQGGLTVSGRPILNLSFALNHAVSGYAVWSYHALNLAIHAGAALLLFGLVRRTLARPQFRSRFGGRATPLALGLAALWALHPLQTQAVTYTVQRAESLMGFFYLLTLYAFARATQCHPLDDTHFSSCDGKHAQCHPLDDSAAKRHRPRWLAVAVVACVFGMATKEVMATAPLMVLLYDRTFVAGTFRDAWRERRGFFLTLAATWLLLGALVWSTGGNRGGTVGLDVGVPLWAYPLTQFQALARYLALSLWPHPLVFEYGTFWVQRGSDVLPSAAVVVPLLVATFVTFRRWPVAGFCGAWFFAVLAPTSLAPGTIQMIVEHRMYLPLAAVLVLGAVGLHAWFGRRAFFLLGACALALAALTVHRNHDYRSRLSLWSATVALRPDNPRAREGLAEALVDAGRLDLAIAQYAETVRLKPDESTYHYNLARTLALAGRRPEAIRHYELALRLVPDEPNAHNNLAVVLVESGRIEEALPHYAAAERLRPTDAPAHYNHALALARLGRVQESITEYETALRLKPDYSEAHLNLGSALVTTGRVEEGITHLLAAGRLEPNDAEIGTTLGGALLVAGRIDDSMAQFRAVLTTHPDSAEAHYGLGNATGAAGRRSEAAAHYEVALRLAPNHVNAHFKLGNLLFDDNRLPEAIGHYEATVRLKPDDAEAHHNLGVACARLDRFAEARTHFEAAVRLQPNYTEAIQHLQQVRALLGEAAK